MNKPKSINKQIVSVDDLGKVDINFPEFCFGVIGRSKVDDQPKEILYQLKNNPESRIVLTRSVWGFPDQTTRDIMHALIRITYKKNRFSSFEVPCSINEIIEELGWSKGGKGIKLLKKHLDVLRGTGVKFENSYFDKSIKKHLGEVFAFGILGGYWFREIKSDGTLSDKRKDLNSLLSKGFFYWDPKYFEKSLTKSMNLIDFDYTFYMTLSQDTAKQLFLFLSKRSFSTDKLRIPLDEVAFTVLGMSEKMRPEMHKVRYLLKKTHKQLMEKGFLPTEPEFVKDFAGTEYVTYYLPRRQALIKIVDSEGIGIQNSNEDYKAVKSILTAFGATDGQVARLVKKQPLEALLEVLKQIQLQYPEPKKVKNIIGLVNKLMEGEADLSLAQEETRRKLAVQEKLRQEEESKAAQDKIEAERKAKKEVQAKEVDKWIVANMLEYLEICERLIEDRIKPNPVFNLFLKNEVKKSGTSETKAVFSHPILNSVLREEIGERIFGEKLV